jgi:predicted transcriptional regulator
VPELTNLDVTTVSLVNRAAVRDPINQDQPMRFHLIKGEVPVWKQEGLIDPNGGGHMTDAEMLAAVEKAEAERDEAKAALQKAETEREEVSKRVEVLEKAAKKPVDDDGDDSDADDLNKADLPPAVRARIEKLEKDAADKDSRLEKAEKMAKQERETRLIREFVEKAEQYDALSQDPLEFGPVLKSAHEAMSSEHFDALETLLKAANEQVRQGDLFKEQGKGGDGPKGGDAYSELAKAAKELRKEDRSLSPTAALEAAMANDPELQAKYLAEVR